MSDYIKFIYRGNFCNVAVTEEMWEDSLMWVEVLDRIKEKFAQESLMRLHEEIEQSYPEDEESC